MSNQVASSETDNANLFRTGVKNCADLYARAYSDGQLVQMLETIAAEISFDPPKATSHALLKLGIMVCLVNTIKYSHEDIQAVQNVVDNLITSVVLPDRDITIFGAVVLDKIEFYYLKSLKIGRPRSLEIADPLREELESLARDAVAKLQQAQSNQGEAQQGKNQRGEAQQREAQQAEDRQREDQHREPLNAQSQQGEVTQEGSQQRQNISQWTPITPRTSKLYDFEYENRGFD